MIKIEKLKVYAVVADVVVNNLIYNHLHVGLSYTLDEALNEMEAVIKRDPFFSKYQRIQPAYHTTLSITEILQHIGLTGESRRSDLLKLLIKEGDEQLTKRLSPYLKPFELQYIREKTNDKKTSKKQSSPKPSHS